MSVNQNIPPQDPRTVVKMGEQLYSSQVALANGSGECDTREVAYEFSGGKRFIGKRDPYNPPAL